ncbi:group I intron-associated PD-(D/E)XK endonuclease [Flavobacterium sp. J372]|uniref:group I intron-associated PD-(D/E)XK endonuclease n=1 Tax=Flavobacterium sp. J372 TaxID=2898436 RepID=UPI002151DD03|nr:group I intron-associated PD-(D/E)XK endonuclease [Flavobacterium sp. J372]MCR5861485.1 group I intron-associated PD-(D/E)XK endonuclease [Flavobacterium sp. J372]
MSEYKKLHHSQTGIAAEFYAAGELARMGYNVTFTFGNTKSIDLLVEKENSIRAIQVKEFKGVNLYAGILIKQKLLIILYIYLLIFMLI